MYKSAYKKWCNVVRSKLDQNETGLARIQAGRGTVIAIQHQPLPPPTNKMRQLILLIYCAA